MMIHLSEEQIVEFRRRQRIGSNLMCMFRSKTLPPIEEFNPEDLDY